MDLKNTPAFYYFDRKIKRLLEIAEKIDKATINGISILKENTTIIEGSKSFTPGTIANSANVTTIVTVQGATVDGQFTPKVRFSSPLQGIIPTAQTTAANQVTVTFPNNTGSSKTLAAGTLTVRIDV